MKPAHGKGAQGEPEGCRLLAVGGQKLGRDLAFTKGRPSKEGWMERRAIPASDMGCGRCQRRAFVLNWKCTTGVWTRKAWASKGETPWETQRGMGWREGRKVKVCFWPCIRWRPAWRRRKTGATGLAGPRNTEAVAPLPGQGRLQLLLLLGQLHLEFRNLRLQVCDLLVEIAGLSLQLPFQLLQLLPVLLLLL